MRSLLISVLILGLTGCAVAYRLPTRQGNVIEQKQLDQLQVGMTEDQVKFLLGTPIAADPFRGNRWDYFGYYKSPHGQIVSRDVTLYFEDSKLARMDGIKISGAYYNVGNPDADDLSAEVKRDQLENARHAAAKDKNTGVAFPAP
jgi:outer membrane protein assembly factor BamE